MSRSKDSAHLNMLAMSFTLPVFHDAIFPLNSKAKANMKLMSTKRSVFHFETSPLKLLAAWNI